MVKWSERLVGAWFGAVGMVLILATWQVVSIRRAPAGLSLGEILPSVAVFVAVAALLAMPLLVVAAILDRATRVRRHGS